MELTERVHKLELGHTDHEIRLKKVEQENERQHENELVFHDFIVKTEARAEGRDKTLKVFMSVLTVASILSPAVTILIQNLVR